MNCNGSKNQFNLNGTMNDSNLKPHMFNFMFSNFISFIMDLSDVREWLTEMNDWSEWLLKQKINMTNSNTGKKCTSGLNYSYSLLHSNISIDFKPKCFSCDFAMRQKSLYRSPTSLTGYPAGIYLSKTAMETPKQDVKSVWSYN